MNELVAEWKDVDRDDLGAYLVFQINRYFLGWWRDGHICRWAVDG